MGRFLRYSNYFTCHNTAHVLQAAKIRNDDNLRELDLGESLSIPRRCGEASDTSIWIPFIAYVRGAQGPYSEPRRIKNNLILE